MAIGENIFYSDNAEKSGVLVFIRELGYLAGTWGFRSLNLEVTAYTVVPVPEDSIEKEPFRPNPVTLLM